MLSPVPSLHFDFELEAAADADALLIRASVNNSFRYFFSQERERERDLILISLRELLEKWLKPVWKFVSVSEFYFLQMFVKALVFWSKP